MAANFSPSGLAFFVLTVVFLVICGIFIALRFVALVMSRRTFSLDDLFIIVAYVNTVAIGVVSMWSSVNGLGKSAAVLTDYEIAAAAKLLFTSYICWLLASVFYKLAILSLYNRIFTTPQFRRWSYGVSALVIGYCIAYFCVYMTNCEPIDHMWNPTPDGHCRDGHVGEYCTLAINMFLDLVILILPMPTLWKLKLPTRKKVAVTAMFSFGLLTIAVMIWRAIWTYQYRDDPDFTSFLSLIAIASGFELWFGIIVANIPTLAPLFKPGQFSNLRTWSGWKKSSSSAFSGSWMQTPIHLKTFYGSGKRDRVANEGSRDHFFPEAQNGESAHERGLEGLSSVTAQCAYDPSVKKPMSPPASDGIYFQISIEDGVKS
ncbi:hypothetical protein KVR01_003109 [Diaporthe batatas]|uniref:uncharacterized protein n=1 Tax=Diaporthe batatas TaxID=748121 RepID=UPI001D0564D7|nr:uncharacterized protein KVR01_003109 [Diaporthe batatas]KAG8167420.1 hypothetical protein KVR01_003109 [Diaporthe batatas]